MDTDNKELKKLYMDKIILGTIYVVLKYIKNNNLSIFENGLYDVDDIINTFVEIWIKRINNGDLLCANSYSDILNFTFVREVCNSLIESEDIFCDQIRMTRESFCNLLYEFIQLKNSGKDFNFDEVIDNSGIGYRDSWNVKEELFYTIYDNLEFDKKDDLVVNKSKIKAFLKLFLYSGL